MKTITKIVYKMCHLGLLTLVSLALIALDFIVADLIWVKYKLPNVYVTWYVVIKPTFCFSMLLLVNVFILALVADFLSKVFKKEDHEQ